MQISENKLNTKHAIIYFLLGISYPTLFFLLLFKSGKIFSAESELVIPLAFTCVILWNLFVMFASKIHGEFERNLKLMDYFAFGAIRKPGQKFDWKEAIVKYENGEMSAFLTRFFYIKIYSCIGLWLIFLLF